MDEVEEISKLPPDENSMDTYHKALYCELLLQCITKYMKQEQPDLEIDEEAYYNPYKFMEDLVKPFVAQMEEVYIKLKKFLVNKLTRLKEELTELEQNENENAESSNSRSLQEDLEAERCAEENLRSRRAYVLSRAREMEVLVLAVVAERRRLMRQHLARVEIERLLGRMLQGGGVMQPPSKQYCLQVLGRWREDVAKSLEEYEQLVDGAKSTMQPLQQEIEELERRWRGLIAIEKEDTSLGEEQSGLSDSTLFRVTPFRREDGSSLPTGGGSEELSQEEEAEDLPAQEEELDPLDSADAQWYAGERSILEEIPTDLSPIKFPRKSHLYMGRHVKNIPTLPSPPSPVKHTLMDSSFERWLEGEKSPKLPESPWWRGRTPESSPNSRSPIHFLPSPEKYKRKKRTKPGPKWGYRTPPEQRPIKPPKDRRGLSRYDASFLTTPDTPESPPVQYMSGLPETAEEILDPRAGRRYTQRPPSPHLNRRHWESPDQDGWTYEWQPGDTWPPKADIPPTFQESPPKTPPGSTWVPPYPIPNQEALGAAFGESLPQKPHGSTWVPPYPIPDSDDSYSSSDANQNGSYAQRRSPIRTVAQLDAIRGRFEKPAQFQTPYPLDLSSESQLSSETDPSFHSQTPQLEAAQFQTPYPLDLSSESLQSSETDPSFHSQLEAAQFQTPYPKDLSSESLQSSEPDPTFDYQTPRYEAPQFQTPETWHSGPGIQDLTSESGQSSEPGPSPQFQTPRAQKLSSESQQSTESSPSFQYPIPRFQARTLYKSINRYTEQRSSSDSPPAWPYQPEAQTPQGSPQASEPSPVSDQSSSQPSPSYEQQPSSPEQDQPKTSTPEQDQPKTSTPFIHPPGTEWAYNPPQPETPDLQLSSQYQSRPPSKIPDLKWGYQPPPGRFQPDTTGSSDFIHSPIRGRMQRLEMPKLSIEEEPYEKKRALQTRGAMVLHSSFKLKSPRREDPFQLDIEVNERPKRTSSGNLEYDIRLKMKSKPTDLSFQAKDLSEQSSAENGGGQTDGSSLGILEGFDQSGGLDDSLGTSNLMIQNQDRGRSDDSSSLGILKSHELEDSFNVS